MRKVLPYLFISTLLLTACAGNAAPPSGDLKVVASTTIVGDVVSQVGGDLIDLTVLFPPGADPHTFEPRPQDIAAISDAQVIVINGLGLEETLQPTLEANAGGPVVHASEGIEVLEFGGHKEEDHDREHESGDPHTWTDPNNVIVWVGNIAAALEKADPENAAGYQANAAAYISRLQELDLWIHTRVDSIPPGRRKLVTDHVVFGYFADEYGFEQVGFVVPAASTSAAPSAKELAELTDLIRELEAPAIFVSTTVNPALSEQIAQDAGAQVVFVYTGSLSESGAEAGDYLAFMRYDVEVIVAALK